MTEAPQRYDALIGIGSNIGDKIANVRRALELLCSEGSVRLVRFSRLYRSAPWGILDQDWFVNAAAAVATELSADDLLSRCLAAEDEMGRQREVKWGPRVVDVDLLTYRGLTIQTERLTVPHPFIEKRSFVLLPLLDIAPDEIVRGCTVADLVRAVDTSDTVVMPDA